MYFLFFSFNSWNRQGWLWIDQAGISASGPFWASLAGWWGYIFLSLAGWWGLLVRFPNPPDIFWQVGGYIYPGTYLQPGRLVMVRPAGISAVVTPIIPTSWIITRKSTTKLYVCSHFFSLIHIFCLLHSKDAPKAKLLTVWNTGALSEVKQRAFLQRM